MRATQPVTIEGIPFDALIESTNTLEATVPEYSVEDGFPVSDAIILKPETLSMTLFITDTPVSWFHLHSSWFGRTEQMCARLKELYYQAAPVTVVTSEATWESMAIESLSFRKTTEIGYAREITISLKKIRVTSASTTTIPDSYGKSGATEAAAGTASTTQASPASAGYSGSSASGVGSTNGASSGSGGSVAYNLASWSGWIS